MCNEKPLCFLEKQNQHMQETHSDILTNTSQTRKCNHDQPTQKITQHQ